MSNLPLNLYTLKSQFQGPKSVFNLTQLVIFLLWGSWWRAENTENLFQKMWFVLRF